MADSFSIGTGIVNVIDLATQITQFLVQFGLDWEDAPHDAKAFMAELQTLKTVLSTSNRNATLNLDFAESFQSRSSLILSQPGPGVSPIAHTEVMLQTCEKELNDLVDELKRRAKGHQVGWERTKGAFSAKNTQESVGNLHRWCQELNNFASVDTAALVETTYGAVREAKKEHQEEREEQQEWRQAEADTEILTWLAPVDYAPQQNTFISRRQEGTGQWLLTSSQFRDWVDRSNQTLFCPGFPGAGKTMSTAIVVDELYTRFQNDPSVAIAYVYCDVRRQYEQKPIDLLASLLKQLIQGQPSVPQSIQQLYEQHQRTRTRPLIDEITQALRSIIRDYSRIFIVVDAIDECQNLDRGRKRLLAELLDLRVKTAVNLFATSRFIPEIEKGFDGKSTKLEIRASDEDLQKFLDGHILKLPSFISGSTDFQREVKCAIIKAAHGMFLLVELYLDSLIGKPSPKAVRATLERLPKGSGAYDQPYREAMERIEGQDSDSKNLAKRVLSWISCAKRPLTTLELQYALAVEIGGIEFDEENLSKIENMISACAGLVTVDEESNVIRFFHDTAQEFFERTWKEWFPNAQRDMAMTCVTYLSFDVFESGPCLSDEKFEDQLRLHPLYDYAARNWGYHSYDSTDAQCSVPAFLRSEAKTSACSQAMMVPTGYRFAKYSQVVPQQITVVHLAAWFGLTKIVGMLLEDGYGSNWKNSCGRTPLSDAARYGHEAVVRLLLEQSDVEINSKDRHGRMPLSYAAQYGHETVVRLLVERDDVEADSGDADGRTPLLYAAENGHEAVVRLLVERGDVETDSKDEDDRTPLSYAVGSGHEAVVRLLVERDDVKADSRDGFGWTPLLYAARYGHEAVVRLLVERSDVEANSRNFALRTPLSYAAEYGHEAVVRLLVKRDDVKADSKGTSGRTPLSYAAEHGHETVVRLLMRRDDVKVDLKDGLGWTPLSYAAKHEHEVVVRLLVERGDVEADSKDGYGRTPLSYAAEYGRGAVVRLLVERDDVKADLKDEDGRTPLSYAARCGHEAVVRLMLERDDVEADSKDGYGPSPLSYAAEHGHEAIVQLLMERDDVQINSKDQYGRTPLSYASEYGREAAVRLLVERADVEANSEDVYGRTPLSYAAEYGHEAVVRLLVEWDDVEISPKDLYGRTPLSYAEQYGRGAVVRLLAELDDGEAYLERWSWEFLE